MATNRTPTNPDALLSLVERIKGNYQGPPPPPPKRGKKRDFSALCFLPPAAIVVTLRAFSNSELRKLLVKDRRLRLAGGVEPVSYCASIRRRLSGLAPEVELKAALLGQQIVEVVQPEEERSEVSAVGGRMYEARGAKWRKNDRRKGVAPVGLRKVDTESKWSKSVAAVVIGSLKIRSHSLKTRLLVSNTLLLS